jgi:hypothetical protein
LKCIVCGSEALDGRTLCQRCLDFWQNFNDNTKPLSGNGLKHEQTMALILMDGIDTFTKDKRKEAQR